MDIGLLGQLPQLPDQFSALNRWDQRAKFELRRQEIGAPDVVRRTSAARCCRRTDLIDLGGIPYRQTGAEHGRRPRRRRVRARRARTRFTSSASYQAVSFDRPEKSTTRSCAAAASSSR